MHDGLAAKRHSLVEQTQPISHTAFAGSGQRHQAPLFDDDLVAKTKEAFQVEAFSTSALAAPALAAAALDSAIRNSFEVGGRLMVIAELPVDAVLEGQTVAELCDGCSILVLHLVRADGSVHFDPAGAVRLTRGDRVTVQATLSAYRELRARIGRAA